MNFFIHSLNRSAFFKKNAYALLVFFNRVPYMQISDMTPGVNKIGGKVSVASVNEAGGSGGVLRPSGGFRGRSALRKFLRSKEHLHWLKMDLNVTEIITVQDYKHTQKN